HRPCREDVHGRGKPLTREAGGRGGAGTRRPGVRRRGGGGVVSVRHSGGTAEHPSPQGVRGDSRHAAYYRIACILVDKKYRRRGVTATALSGAVDLIARVGGG